MKGFYPLNENIFVEDDFLSSFGTYIRVREPASASLCSRDNSKEGMSAGYVKVSAELIGHFHKNII
jgi:hypothetical protein